MGRTECSKESFSFRQICRGSETPGDITHELTLKRLGNLVKEGKSLVKIIYHTCIGFSKHKFFCELLDKAKVF